MVGWYTIPPLADSTGRCRPGRSVTAWDPHSKHRILIRLAVRGDPRRFGWRLIGRKRRGTRPNRLKGFTVYEATRQSPGAHRGFVACHLTRARGRLADSGIESSLTPSEYSPRK